MLKVQGNINDRQIIYFHMGVGLEEFQVLDLQSWALFVIADDSSHPLLRPFAEFCVDKSLLYMCATGKACSEIDDLFDIVMIDRNAKQGKMPDWHQYDEDVLMTTWHHDFSEGFWFVTTQARYEDFPIKTILVTNFTRNDFYKKIQQLTEDINAGWLPPD